MSLNKDCIRTFRRIIRKSGNNRFKYLKIFRNYLQKEYVWPIFQNSSFDLLIKKIKYKIFKQEIPIELNLQPYCNLIINDQVESEVINHLLKKIFLYSDNRELNNNLDLLKRENEEFDPEIIIFIKIANEDHILRYNHKKEEYYIDNILKKNKSDYFFNIIKILKYKEYNTEKYKKNWPIANTRLKKLSECIFYDIYGSNIFTIERNEEFKLFFESEINILLKLFIEILNSEKNDIEKKFYQQIDNLNQLDSRKSQIESEFENLKQYEEIIRYYNEKSINFDNLEDINEEIEKKKKLIIDITEKRKNFSSINLDKIKKLKQEKKQIRSEIGKVLRNYKELEQDQIKLTINSFKLQNNDCYCHRQLPIHIKEKIEKTQECPICGGPLDFDLTNEKNKIQQELNNLRRNITYLKNIYNKKCKEVVEIKNDLNKIEIPKEPNDNVKEIDYIDSEKRIISEQTELEAYKNHFPIFRDIKSRIISLEEDKKEIEHLKQEKINECDILRNGINECEELSKYFQKYIDQNDNVKDRLRIKLGRFQTRFFSIFKKNKELKTVICDNKDLNEITVKADLTDIGDNILHLNYFLSLLKLILLQTRINLDDFHSFPIQIIRKINDVDVLEKMVKIISKLKYFNKTFQIITFFPKNKVDLIKHLSENIEIITVKKQRNFKTQKSMIEFLEKKEKDIIKTD